MFIEPAEHLQQSCFFVERETAGFLKLIRNLENTAPTLRIFVKAR
jgi:hypothetical protein